MKIAYLAAGAAGMVCGSCLHDNTLAAELLRLGEDVVLVPIYTPLRSDEQNVSLPRVFFGGINVYLQQNWSLFRHTPRWFDNLLDHPALLGKLATRAHTVDPQQLGELTVSMLRGEHGNQSKELDKLVDWLIAEIQPEVVHLSNSMMVGLARKIAKRCGPPVICSLSGEDIFLEKLTEPYYSQTRTLLRERAKDVHAFVALNNYYADFMAAYLAVERNRIHVIPHGLQLEGHGVRSDQSLNQPCRIGFLARVCHDKGLHLLVQACELLCDRSDIPHFELHAAGYLGAGDRGYFQSLTDEIARGPLANRFKYLGEISRSEKIAFLQELDIFSTPTIYHESKGLPALEALANGVPVVLPRHGCFPELIAQTRGGLLYKPESAPDLAAKLAELLLNPGQARELGERGQQSIRANFHATAMANKTLDLYRCLLGGGK